MSRLRALYALVAPLVWLLLGLAGLMLLRGQYWTAGATALALALAAWITETRSPETITAIDGPAPFRIPVLQAVLWSTVIGLNGIAVRDVLHPAPGMGDYLGETAWLCSVLIGLLTIWFSGVTPRARRPILEYVAAHRGELVLLLVTVLVALAVRTIALSAHPYPWSGDEASVAAEAARILGGDTTAFFQTGWSNQPYWSFVPTAAVQGLFGTGMFSTRLTSALIGTAAVVAVYLAARTLFDGTIGVMAAAFLATLPYHVHFSRLGFHNILDSLTSSTGVWLAVRAVQSNDPRVYYSAGAVTGLTIYSYPGSRLALVLAGVSLVYWSYRERTGWLGRQALSFAAGAIISAMPQAMFFAINPARFLSRLGEEGILLNGWLSAHAAETGASVPRILLDQFSTTVLTFVALPAWGHVFNSPYPYLTLPESLLFLAGLGTALAWLLTPRYFILLVWFWSVIILGGMLTMDPPANTRLLMTTPAAAILMAVGLRTIFEQFRRRGFAAGRAFAPACILVVAGIGAQNVRFYLVEYPRAMYFQDANSEFAMEVGLMARDLGGDVQLYLLGAPRIFTSFPTLGYLARHAAPRNLTTADLEGLELPRGKRSAFFATPENRALLEQLQRQYPGGSSGVMHRKSRPDEILFAYYLVSR